MKYFKLAALCFSLVTAATAPAQDGIQSANAAVDEGAGRFPREWVTDAGSIIVHAPEIEAWPDFADLAARAAVEVTLEGDDEPTLGAILFSAATEANLDLRLIALDNITLTDVSFADTVPEARQTEFERFIRNTLPGAPTEVPLEVVLSYISPDAMLPSVEGVQADPPPIFYSTSPAILVQTDGEALLAPIPDTRIQYVINTNWDLFRYRDREWYLLHDGYWLTSDNLTGPWEWDRRLPGDFEDLPDDGNWDTALAAIPAQRAEVDPPTVFYSDRPAELIALDGEPRRITVGGAGLEYISNTDSDLFVYDSRYYFLVSGRWFQSERLRGPWAHEIMLPEAFAAIPSDHPKARVRASVPGTDEARLAALEALIPRRATIRRDAGDNVDVTYFGEPSFELITGTTVSRVINSANDVLLADGRYYLCLNAVWYVSDEADGPWEVADLIPASIYTIPASSPSYHVTNVHVYESDDETVSTGYTGGYVGLYVGFGIAMYGTGWYYPPYYYYDPFYHPYPYYYPYPYSYGSRAYYNPNTGMYGRADSVYGPYGGYGRASSYNPQTGTYARGAAVWDNNQIAGSGYAYNPRSGTGIAANRYAYEDGGWGETLVTRDDRWLYTNGEWTENSRRTQFETSGGATGELQSQRSGDIVTRELDVARGDQSLSALSQRSDRGTAIGVETGQGERAAIGRDASTGDLYAGRDGNVYRRSDDAWYQHDGQGGWDQIEVPADAAARVDQGRSAVQDRLSSSDRFGGLSSSGDRSRSFDRSGSLGSSARSRDLNRSYGARSGGYSRFDNARSRGLGGGGLRGGGGFRRR
jgi:hypothetical protein